jgi:tetratricopeptide (TPR) repeat protein
MIPLDFPPANFEVEDQLKRMLTSPRFRNAPNPSAFLELGVRRALKGKKTTGRVVGDVLFKGKLIPGESSDVRITARNLRKTIEKYYACEGRDDIVIISFADPQTDVTIKPVEGEAYTPRFGYNQRFSSLVVSRMGFRCLEQSTYRDHRHAFSIFTSILKNDPNNIAAALGLIQTISNFAERKWEYPIQIEPFDVCIGLFEKLEKRAEKYWRLWAAKAYFWKGTGNDELVASCYEKAVSSNRTATESFRPYIEFLFANGRDKEGLGLAERYVVERIEDSTAVAWYGKTIFRSGRHDVGIEHLYTALRMDPGNCLAHETMAAIRLMQKNRKGVFTHLLALQALCDTDSFKLIVKFLEENEEQLDMKGCVAELLPQLAPVASVAIVSR